MTIILLLIGISLVLALSFLAAFFWAVKDGQYDDEHTPAMRVLLDDEDIQLDKITNLKDE